MFGANFDGIDVDAVFVPPVGLGNSDVVAAHLALAHKAVVVKRPVLYMYSANRQRMHIALSADTIRRPTGDSDVPPGRKCGTTDAYRLPCPHTTRRRTAGGAVEV